MWNASRIYGLFNFRCRKQYKKYFSGMQHVAEYSFWPIFNFVWNSYSPFSKYIWDNLLTKEKKGLRNFKPQSFAFHYCQDPFFIGNWTQQQNIFIWSDKYKEGNFIFGYFDKRIRRIFGHSVLFAKFPRKAYCGCIWKYHYFSVRCPCISSKSQTKKTTLCTS